MRVLICLIVFIVCGPAGKAQTPGNLQFNQIRYIEFTAQTEINGYILDSISLNVPQGKVLKIESAHCNMIFEGNANAKVLLNNKVIVACHNIADQYPPVFPIWLPSGDYNLILWGEYSGTKYYGDISAIEFNTVP